MVEQPQNGYQESPMYQSLVPQNGQFSPALEGPHNSFLNGKGGNILECNCFKPEYIIFHSVVLYELIVKLFIASR